MARRDDQEKDNYVSSLKDYTVCSCDLAPMITSSQDLFVPVLVGQVHAHVLGSKQGSDVILFEEPDPACFVGLTRTKDWKLLLINSHSKLSSEVGGTVCSFGRSAMDLQHGNEHSLLPIICMHVLALPASGAQA